MAGPPSLSSPTSWPLSALRLRLFSRPFRLPYIYRSRFFVAVGCASRSASLALAGIMADYNYGGSEEENAELRKLEAELVWPLASLLHVSGVADMD